VFLFQVDLISHLANIHWDQQDLDTWKWLPEEEMDKKYVEAAEKRLGRQLPIYPEQMSVFVEPTAKKGHKRKRNDEEEEDSGPAAPGLGLAASS